MEKEAQEKYGSIVGTCDWILIKILTLQSNLLKIELQKEVNKLQDHLNVA